MAMMTRQTIRVSFMRRFRCALHVILVLCSIAAITHAQQVDLVTKIRLAQSFEQAGEWERAAAVYESLLESNPQNYVVLDGLRRSYTELKQYDKAMDLVRQQLRSNPADENLLVILGNLYDLAGQSQKADSLWHVVIKKDVKNPNLYRIVAVQLTEHRQYEKAIQIYLEGRRTINNPMLFVEELAALYGALHQYDAATHEYVKLVQSSPQQVVYIQSRLASFTGLEEGRRAAIEVVKTEAEHKPEQVTMRSVLAWLYMEGKDFEAALEQYRIIDKLTKANGFELFQFGQRAAQEHAFAVSAKAFREVIERNALQSFVPFARLGYARDIEELSATSDTLMQTRTTAAAPTQINGRGTTVSETQPTFQGALGLYESIIAEYPNSETAMQALFRIGTIRFNRFFDLDGAASAFDGVRKMSFSSNLTYEATLGLAEIETARNNLNRARQEYIQLGKIAPEQYRDRVLFRLAELDYFEAHFDSASAKLQSISVNAASDLTNDALLLLYFIQENRAAGPAALTEFAYADLFMRQRKHSEVLARFEGLTTQYPTTTLVDDATMRIGELQLLLNHVNEAIAVFRKVVNDMPTSILRDHAQMRIAEIYQNRLNDKPKAIEAYEQLLADYPTSLLVEEARKRIRILRGDAI